MPALQTLEASESYAKVVLEPLERGYAQTLGNSLRRVLLSSVPGAAVTAIRIDNVLHEFAEIPGVKEDTTMLMLNLKGLAIRIDAMPEDPDEEVILHLDIKGPGRVTAADIECPDGVEIVNPEHYLATISGKESLRAQLHVENGTGYLMPDRNEKTKGMIGLIATGSQFTPVSKVNYLVEQTRVGTRTDYERLILECWTNGTVSGVDAVTQAASILKRYFDMFTELGEDVAAPVIPIAEDYHDEFSHIPETPIEELDFTQRTFNCLRRAGIQDLRQLARTSELELNSIRGFGRKSLVEVEERLQERGLDIRRDGSAAAVGVGEDY